MAKAILHCHIPVTGPTKALFSGLYSLHVLVTETLRWCIRFLWFEPLFRSQCVSVGAGFNMEQLPYLKGKGRIFIASNVRLSGKSTIEFSRAFRDDPEFRIGAGTFVGHGCAFHIADRVEIGNNCLIAAGVTVFDLDGHPLDAEQRRKGLPSPRDKVQRVIVGNDVWIGLGVTILKGVSVGDRAIIALRSVVTKDVPPDTIVAGNPAVVVKRLNANG